MNETEINEPAAGNSMPKLPVAGAIVALAGLADSVYLTVHHLTAEPVPCSLISGCETVLTSTYAEIGGIPLAAFGAAAYFVAFSLALLTAFGNRITWKLFGIQVVLMSVFTVWLLYLQGFVIGAFCQFCLISAITTFTMLGIYIASRFTR
jgi:uncharacterized membrane protein